MQSRQKHTYQSKKYVSMRRWEQIITPTYKTKTNYTLAPNTY